MRKDELNDILYEMKRHNSGDYKTIDYIEIKIDYYDKIIRIRSKKK